MLTIVTMSTIIDIDIDSSTVPSHQQGYDGFVDQEQPTTSNAAAADQEEALPDQSSNAIDDANQMIIDEELPSVIYRMPNT